MTQVKIKDDLHTSEKNFKEFRSLKSKYEAVFAEVKRNRRNTSVKAADTIFGKSFLLCVKLFFMTFGRTQRDQKPQSDVQPLDLEFDEMPGKLETIDKLKLSIAAIPLILITLLPALSNIGILLKAILLLIIASCSLVIYFTVFLMIVNVRREEHMASIIASEASQGNSVLAYMGAAHASRVKSRLEQKDLEVTRDRLDGRVNILLYWISHVLFIIPRPIDYLRKGY